mgnify:CR=1 FL=1
MATMNDVARIKANALLGNNINEFQAREDIRTLLEMIDRQEERIENFREGLANIYEAGDVLDHVFELTHVANHLLVSDDFGWPDGWRYELIAVDEEDEE